MRILFLTLFLTGCLPDYDYQVTCDSGFETPISDNAYTQGGSIHWVNSSRWSERKMFPGEICTSKKILNR